MLNNLNLRAKLIIFFLMVGVIPLAVVSFLNFNEADSALDKEAFNKLNAVQELKHAQIEDYFEQKKGELLIYSYNTAMVQAVDRFAKAAENDGINGDTWEKWNELHGPKLEDYIKAKGYYDLFMISPEGKVVYTAAKESDLGANLQRGDLSNSGLAKAYREGKNGFAFVDFSWYTISNEPACFISAPVEDKQNGFVGVLAFQISLDKINEIMQSRTGLGKTGETYLVGSDFKMRSDSYLDPTKHSVKASFEGTVEENGARTEAVEKALAGKNGHGIIEDYTGNEVLSSYSSLDLPGGKTTWAILAEVNKDEAFAASASMMNSVILFGLIFAAIIGGFGFLFSKRISNPIVKLSGAAEKVANGDTDVQVDVNSNDEIGNLATAFNTMVEKIELQLGYLDNLPTPVMLTDKNFNITYMNKKGAEVVGKDQQTLIGQKCYDNFKTDHCNTDKCACKQAMDLDRIVSEETVSHAQEKDLPIMYTGAPIKDKEGKLIGALEYVADITEIKEIQTYLERSTKKILNEMDKFSNGDLTVNVEPERRDDDIGQLFIGFNKAVMNIREMINEVTDAVQATSSASTQISSSSEELAAGAQEQSAQATEVASAVEEMTRTIIENSKNAEQATNKAKGAGEEATGGGEIVKQTVEGMKELAEVVKNAAAKVKELGTNTDQIGEIIQVIDDIADQTNLLALNAAIEAARAGEEGRGFAVVADEVRKLAERTTKATQEIAGKIKQIQSDTGGVVTSIEQGSQKADEGSNNAVMAGDSLNKIILSSQEVVDAINQVAAASEQQSSSSEQISRNIESISSVTNQTASGTEQIARSAEDLNRLTENLNALVGRFKVSSNGKKTYKTDSSQSEQSIAEDGRLVADAEAYSGNGH